jgi:hypothetical protein
MPLYNKNSGYGQFTGKDTNGKVFVLASASESNYQTLADLFSSDPEGKLRIFNTWATAIAATVAGRGDKILVSKGFTTAPTLAQLATMNTNGVLAEVMGGKQGNYYVANRASATLPATAATPYFTVTGKVKILNIIGEVTTVVQTQACNGKLIANPTVGADVDLCAVLDITAGAVGALFTITGTLANAMIKTVSAAVPSQASPVIVTAGTIDLSTSATNTGATKWTVVYEPIDPGSMVLPA